LKLKEALWDRYVTAKHAIRAVIQSSQATTAALSRDLGVNVEALAKWRKRVPFEDRKTGATQPSSTVPNANEDAMIVAVRRPTVLSMDDCYRSYNQPSRT